MSLLQLDRADLEPEQTLALYRAVLPWAAARGTAFVLTVEPSVYDDPREVARFQALEQPVAGLPPVTRPPPADGALQVLGVPDERFVRAMTDSAAPEAARAGDECPVDAVIICAGERALYVCYDYGAVQILDIDEAERRDLERTLEEAGLPHVAFFRIDGVRARTDSATLIAICRSGSPTERMDAIVDLQEMGAVDAVPALLEQLGHPDAGVRANAACALGDLGAYDERAVGTALAPLTMDPDPLVRLHVVESIGLLGYTPGMSALVDALATDADALVRVHAAEALGMLGDARAVPALALALDDADEKVRAYAADAIAALNSAASAPLLRARLAVEPGLFAKAFLLSALHRLGDQGALTALVELAAGADDLLAGTIFNLAAQTATRADADHLAAVIAEAGRSRPALRAEVESATARLAKLRNSMS